MTISSPAFLNDQLIPSAYTCEGEGVNPPLHITNIPPDTSSLALVVEDPDSPTGLFTHWIVWNIPPTTTDIEADSIPSGAVEGENSLGDVGFAPFCPHTGVHHYQFTLYALSSTLPYVEGTPRERIESDLLQYAIDTAQLTGQYEKHELAFT